jgi:hypothetical protein
MGKLQTIWVRSTGGAARYRRCIRRTSFWLGNIRVVVPKFSGVLVAQVRKGICEEGGVNKRYLTTLVGDTSSALEPTNTSLYGLVRSHSHSPVNCCGDIL